MLEWVAHVNALVMKWLDHKHRHGVTMQHHKVLQTCMCIHCVMHGSSARQGLDLVTSFFMTKKKYVNLAS